MAHQPQPPIPRPKSLRFALTLNLFLPGAGQLYLGRRLRGAVFAVAFLGCFVTMAAIFLRGYGEYLRLSTGGDVLAGDNLEQLAGAFPTPLLLALLIVGIGIFTAAMVDLGFARPVQK
jgi:hypothetical protein